MVVAFLHGASMPIFFPIGLLGLIILYVSDRFRLAYQYKKPPLYSADKALVAHNLILYICPLGLIFLAYWHFTNYRIFYNKTLEIDRKFETQKAIYRDSLISELG